MKPYLSDCSAVQPKDSPRHRCDIRSMVKKGILVERSSFRIWVSSDRYLERIIDIQSLICSSTIDSMPDIPVPVNFDELEYGQFSTCGTYCGSKNVAQSLMLKRIALRDHVGSVRMQSQGIKPWTAGIGRPYSKDTTNRLGIANDDMVRSDSNNGP
jgi:hypothetical protein